jgi:hypothetical protein
MAHFDYYLTADTKDAILADLRSKGFEWYDTDDMGTPTGTRDPKKMEVVSVRGVGSCIYLEHLVETPAVIDDEGNVVTPPTFTTTFHANARMRAETTFDTAMDPSPSTPANVWL